MTLRNDRTNAIVSSWMRITSTSEYHRKIDFPKKRGKLGKIGRKVFRDLDGFHEEGVARNESTEGEERTMVDLVLPLVASVHVHDVSVGGGRRSTPWPRHWPLGSGARFTERARLPSKETAACRTRHYATTDSEGRGT